MVILNLFQVVVLFLSVTGKTRKEIFIFYSSKNAIKIPLIIIVDECEIEIPAQFKNDDFDKCFSDFKDEALYCMSFSHVTNPIGLFNGKSQMIQRGLCLNDCQQAEKKLDHLSDEYFVSRDSSATKIDQINKNIEYPNIHEHRSSYGKIINKCVNFEMMENYNMSAFVEIEYCIKDRDNSSLGIYNHI